MNQNDYFDELARVDLSKHKGIRKRPSPSPIIGPRVVHLDLQLGLSDPILFEGLSIVLSVAAIVYSSLSEITIVTPIMLICPT